VLLGKNEKQQTPTHQWKNTIGHNWHTQKKHWTQLACLKTQWDSLVKPCCSDGSWMGLATSIGAKDGGRGRLSPGRPQTPAVGARDAIIQLTALGCNKNPVWVTNVIERVNETTLVQL